MSQGRKYATLPDLDSAPDVYETQETTEDTKSARSERSSSAASSYQDLDDGPEVDDPAASGVDKGQLQPGQARSHFKSSRVDARKVDFSDRIGGGRRSYKVGSRRRRTEFEATGAGYEDETYEEKLARLRREVEELEALGSQEDSKATAEDKDVVASLNTTLRGLELPSQYSNGAHAAEAENEDSTQAAPGQSAEELSKLSVPDTAETERALSLAAALESRLTSLESALGLSSLALPHSTQSDNSTSATERPIIVTLATLDRQLSTLTSTTAPSLAALASQIDALTASADALASARKAAAAARKDLRSTTGGASRPISSHSFSTSRPSSYNRPRADAPDSAEGEGALSDAAAALLAGEESEQAERVGRLFAQLPTVEALAPLVPSLVDRLASLKALHEAAAVAGEGLDALEKGQARLAADVREWRAALTEVEGRMGEARSGEAKNREVVQGWVRELEGRMAQVQTE